jgi:hypothetical protein
MTRHRTALLASATAAAARAVTLWTSPGEGFAPPRTSISLAQRCARDGVLGDPKSRGDAVNAGTSATSAAHSSLS